MPGDAQGCWPDSFRGAEIYDEWVFAQIVPHIGEGVLEIGCGTGNFRSFLAQHCKRMIEIDLDEGVAIIHGDPAKIGLAGRISPLVRLDVLEHVEDGPGMLRNISAHLKRNGKIGQKSAATQFSGPFRITSVGLGS